MPQEAKKYTWSILAKDFNSPFFRNYIWTGAPLFFTSMLDLPIPQIAIVSKENAITYIGDIKSWAATHEALKEKVLKDFSLIGKLIDDTNSFGEAFNTWSKEYIFNAQLENKTAEELIKLLKDFSEKQSMLYAYGITLPILDFLGGSFVEENVKKFLETKVTEDTEQNYFDIFTYPLHNSFAQEQEEALLKLMTEFYSPEWKKDILTESIEIIRVKYEDFYAQLKRHTEKYTWVYYVYAGPAFSEKQFLDFIKEYVSKDIDPAQKLTELQEKNKKAEELREKAITELNPDSINEFFLRLAGKLVWAKPRRKDYQSHSYYHLEKLHRELAKRTFLSLSQIRSAPIHIIESTLLEKKDRTSLINSIFKFHIVLPLNNKVTLLHSQEAEKFYNESVEKEIEQDFTGIQEIKGNSASPGKKTGIVKIINRPEDMDKMEEGNILVSIATTPSIVPAMKKAAAIITDEGGLTCHAAIVSRELGITCVIGTKFASKVLKDGDLVEVDANKGVITKLIQ